MDEEIRFLRDAAEELRRLANLSPEIAEQLLRLAGELETEARRLESREMFRCGITQVLRTASNSSAGMLSWRRHLARWEPSRGTEGSSGT